MNNISNLIAEKKGYSNLFNELTEKLSGSELNSLLLELFRKRTQKITPPQLLKLFEKNRFAAPSTVDTIDFKEFEIRCLKLAKSKGFIPITLSPLTVLGSCSVVGFVDQNNIISALRGTEVVSDATNVFALLTAKEFKNNKKSSVIKYAATHRHVRGQAFSNPAFTPHFNIFCMATGGKDTGNYSFELEHVLDHITTHLSIFTNELPNKKLLLRIYLKEENKTFEQKLNQSLQQVNNSVTIKSEKQVNTSGYYNLVRFKFFTEHKGTEFNLSDGGFVNWTQQLIPNKKHRLIASGIGTELIHKIIHNQL
jgi:hypothetical protein